MNFKYRKASKNNSVAAECVHCFLSQICNKEQNIAYKKMIEDENKIDEYLDRVMNKREESEYLCENYIEFRGHCDEGVMKGLSYVLRHPSGNKKTDALMIDVFSYAYNQGFKRALDITINNGE